MNFKRLAFRKTFTILILIISLIGAYLFYENSLTQYYPLPSLSLPAIGGKRIVDFNKAFILRKGEIAFVRNTDVSLKITGFVYAPCPKGMQCVWSGLGVDYELTVNGQVYVHPGTAQNAPYYVWIKQSDYKTYAKFLIKKKDESGNLEQIHQPKSKNSVLTASNSSSLCSSVDLVTDNVINALDIVFLLKNWGAYPDSLKLLLNILKHWGKCEQMSNNVWTLVFQNSGFPPNDKFVEGFYAYDMLTKYYKYPKNNIRFITTVNAVSDKWLALGGIKVFDIYNDSAIVSSVNDIYSQPSKQNYVEAINWLQENSTKEDDVLIFSFTHGGSSSKGENFDTDNEYDNDDEYFLLGNQTSGEVENFYDGEFADLVAGIEAKNMFIWISACHSGGFAWDIIDRAEKSGNIENLHIMTPAIDERDVVLVNVSSADHSEVDFDWPDLGEGNFFGFFISGLTGLREEYDNATGNLVLKADQPINSSVDFALDEAKNCKINSTGAPATIGLLDFTEGSKFPMKPVFGCSWSEDSKTPEYPEGEATLGYMNREHMEFVFRVSFD